ncbi:M50 family metallopeptidase [Spongiactinospora sp. TRM90649]|uniref:M50 family metallopeptidase n=1 Tax=Spongiactinospora sp. TRM90649 TaxID=3031114 RepID=UPI0023F67EEC|nr:M50 family metallopeptidase [Spongiactinospora sp. TRM90649]MDF5752332.1 M50 family metallopeptidase [Spongiactinospora sp. TRM90649]
METLSDVWGHLTTTRDAPPTWAILVTALAGLVVVGSSSSWRLSRGLITIAHEGGHALVAVLTRRKLQGIRLHSDTSGVTLTRGRPTGPGMILTALAGYVTPSLLGLGGAWMIAEGYVTLLLWAVLVLLACMLLLIRNLFGVVSLLVTGGAVFALSWFAPDEAQGICAYLAVWFLLLGGIRPIMELQQKRRRGRAPDSDADQLARLTLLPGGFYVFFFLLVAVASLAGGTVLLVPFPLTFG